MPPFTEKRKETFIPKDGKTRVKSTRERESHSVSTSLVLSCRFETRLLDIFSEVHQAYKQFDSRLKAEGFKVRVMRMFRAWEDWAVYPRDFLVKLQNTFLGLVLVSLFAR